MVILSNLPPPSVGIRLEQPSTRVIVDNREIGKGTLFIAESSLSWVNSETNTGFSLCYQNISLHAISRDLNARPYECLYVMVDTCLDEGQNGGNDNEDDDDEEEEKPEYTEMYFVPDDSSRLNDMFTAMNECQALNPDPEDSLSHEEDEDEEDEFEDADSEGEYTVCNDTGNSSVRTNGSRNIIEPMDIEEGQFEDADSSPEN
ncbi:methylosome subunit pICln [Nilaparvata lugens]|uniref:methylosome subunit pICln n=1 Tax=Nilaparvata lugens TaxID=108931 RepID=UPI000B98074B|nr:methylosome subunit pICln [Nilaparvata lugens]